MSTTRSTSPCAILCPAHACLLTRFAPLPTLFTETELDELRKTHDDRQKTSEALADEAKHATFAAIEMKDDANRAFVDMRESMNALAKVEAAEQARTMQRKLFRKQYRSDGFRGESINRLLKRLFNVLDRNGVGVLVKSFVWASLDLKTHNQTEVVAFLEEYPELGSLSQPEHFRPIFEGIPTDKRGSMGFDEFSALCLTMIHAQTLLGVLDIIGMDADGNVPKSEMQAALTEAEYGGGAVVERLGPEPALRILLGPSANLQSLAAQRTTVAGQLDATEFLILCAVGLRDSNLASKNRQEDVLRAVFDLIDQDREEVRLPGRRRMGLFVVFEHVRSKSSGNTAKSETSPPHRSFTPTSTHTSYHASFSCPPPLQGGVYEGHRICSEVQQQGDHAYSRGAGTSRPR